MKVRIIFSADIKIWLGLTGHEITDSCNSSDINWLCLFGH